MNEEMKKIIVEELKAVGMDIAEEAAEKAVKAIFKAIPKALAASENKMDDMLIPLLGLIEPKVMELIDGIDGKKD